MRWVFVVALIGCGARYEGDDGELAAPRPSGHVIAFHPPPGPHPARPLAPIEHNGAAVPWCPSDDPLLVPLGTLSARCPAALPSGPCDAPHATLCEYGNDPRPGCRVVVQCEGSWVVMHNPRCTPLHRGECTAPMAEGGACDDVGSACSADNRVCWCDCDVPVCGTGCATPRVRCLVAQVTERGCTGFAARYGATCEVEGRACYFHSCGAYERLTACRNGVWSDFYPEGDRCEE